MRKEVTNNRKKIRDKKDLRYEYMARVELESEKAKERFRRPVYSGLFSSGKETSDENTIR